MAHVNFDTLKFMFDKDCLENFSVTSFDVSPNVCEGCALGKQHKATYKSDSTKQRSMIPGEFFHGDIVGKMTPSIGNSVYYILFKDDSTAFCFVHFARHKNEALPYF